jgi:hypothetical protein
MPHLVTSDAFPPGNEGLDGSSSFVLVLDKGHISIICVIVKESNDIGIARKRPHWIWATHIRVQDFQRPMRGSWLRGMWGSSMLGKDTHLTVPRSKGQMGGGHINAMQLAMPN